MAGCLPPPSYSDPHLGARPPRNTEQFSPSRNQELPPFRNSPRLWVENRTQAVRLALLSTAGAGLAGVVGGLGSNAS